VILLQERALLVIVGQLYRELGPDRPIRKDMPKFDSSVRQNLANEKPTVAIVRIPLAAHQGDAVAMRAVDQALYSYLERLLFGHRPVQRMTLGIVVLLVRRATP